MSVIERLEQRGNRSAVARRLLAKALADEQADGEGAVIVIELDDEIAPRVEAYVAAVPHATEADAFMHAFHHSLLVEELRRRGLPAP